MAACFGFSRHWTRRRIPAAVDHGGDFRPVLDEVQRRTIALVARRQHHGAQARPHPVVPDQALRSGSGHDPRQVVVAEYGRLARSAGAYNDGLCSDLVEPIALRHGQPAVGKPTGAGRGRQHSHRRERLDAPAQILEGAVVAAGGVQPAVGEPAADLGLALHEHHVQALGAARGGGGQAGRATADDRDIAVGVRLIEVFRPPRLIDLTEARRAADDLLPPVPDTLGFVERLVVEPHGQEALESLQQRRPVRREAPDGVLAPRPHARLDRAQVGVHVGLGLELHQRAGLFAGEPKRSPRTMQLERTRQAPLSMRGQRAGDGVARVAGVGASLELERDSPGTIDPAAGRSRQALRQHRCSDRAAARLRRRARAAETCARSHRRPCRGRQ